MLYTYALLTFTDVTGFAPRRNLIIWLYYDIHSPTHSATIRCNIDVLLRIVIRTDWYKPTCCIGFLLYKEKPINLFVYSHSPTHSSTIRCNIDTLLRIVGTNRYKLTDIPSTPHHTECADQTLVVSYHTQYITWNEHHCNITKCKVRLSKLP